MYQALFSLFSFLFFELHALIFESRLCNETQIIRGDFFISHFLALLFTLFSTPLLIPFYVPPSHLFITRTHGPAANHLFPTIMSLIGHDVSPLLLNSLTARGNSLTLRIYIQCTVLWSHRLSTADRSVSLLTLGIPPLPSCQHPEFKRRL